MIPAVDNWKVARLGEKAYEVRDLYEPSDKEYLPYIGLEHIEQQTLTISDIGSSADTVSTKKYFKKGDILFGSLRPYFRKVVRPRFNGVCSTDITVIRANPGTNQEFLNYFIAAPSFIAHASNISSGTRMPRANWKVLSESKWLFPPLPTQNKIASILSAYDDLIENNLKRIKILEEMAQMIYREWFVNFRFSGHEKVKMVKSELGMIPEGWEVKKLGDFMELAYGKALKADDRRDGKVPVFGSGGICGYHDKALVKGPGIIVGRKGNVGSVFWSDDDFYPIDTVFYVKTELELHYVYYNLLNQNFFNTDAAVPGLNRNQAYSNKFLHPDEVLMKTFAEFINAIFEQKKTLKVKNDNLRKTRDLLLPKLISGEIDVEGLDISTSHEVTI